MSESIGGRIILLCGLPGSGKTATAKQLEDDSGAVRLSPDDWITALGLDAYDGAARARVQHLQWAWTEALVRRGLTVVLENGFWTRADRDSRRVRARELAAAIELRWLDVPLATRWARICARHQRVDTLSYPVSRVDLEEWYRTFEASAPAEQALYDPPR